MWNPNAIIGKWFDSFPENINKEWRPKKGITVVNEKLKEMWYTPATKSQIEDLYMNLIQLEKVELWLLIADSKQSVLVHTLAKAILERWQSFNVIERMLDRGIGKPTNRSEVENSWTQTGAIVIMLPNDD